MNSHWKANSMVFAMMLVSTHSDDQIKIRVFSALESLPWVKLGKNL